MNGRGRKTGRAGELREEMDGGKEEKKERKERRDMKGDRWMEGRKIMKDMLVERMEETRKGRRN